MSERGRVVAFNNAEGHGLIESLERGDRLFVHFSSIDMDGFQTIREGEMVTFVRVLQPGPDGERFVAMLVSCRGSGQARPRDGRK